MRKTLILAAAAMLAAGPGLAETMGYTFQSPAGPEVAWIPSHALDYPDIPAPTVEIDPGLLAVDSNDQSLTYMPERLGAGWQAQSEAGPQLAFVPADDASSHPNWLTQAAELNSEQLGAAPEEEGAEEAGPVTR